MPVAILRGAHNELCALPGRSKSRGVTVLHKLLFILPTLSLNEPHRRKNGSLALVRGQCSQSFLGRQFDIHTEPVRQIPQLLHQLRACTGDGLGVNIAVEGKFPPQKA